MIFIIIFSQKTQMLSNHQIQTVNSLISRTHGTLHGIKAEFQGMFKNVVSVVSAVSILSEQILSNVLQQKQRVIVLYLILTSYPNQEPSKHPFLQTLLYVSESTKELLERKMIADVLIDNNTDNYSGLQMENIEEGLEKGGQLGGERKEIIFLRDKLKQKMKKLKGNVPSINGQVFKVEKEGERGQEKITPKTLDVGFMRPCPDFMEIKPSEFHWLSPGIITDVQWDNTCQIDKKLQKARKILGNALSKSLESSQRSELVSIIQTESYAPLHLGMKPEYLHALLTHNHYLAVSFIVRISKYSGAIEEYLQILLFKPTSIVLIDVISRIIRQVKIPVEYIHLFIIRHINCILKMHGEAEEKVLLGKTMSAFIKCMAMSHLISVVRIQNELKKLIDEFREHFSVHYLEDILDSQ